MRGRMTVKQRSLLLQQVGFPFNLILSLSGLPFILSRNNIISACNVRQVPLADIDIMFLAGHPCF